MFWNFHTLPDTISGIIQLSSNQEYHINTICMFRKWGILASMWPHASIIRGGKAIGPSRSGGICLTNIGWSWTEVVKDRRRSVHLSLLNKIDLKVSILCTFFTIQRHTIRVRICKSHVTFLVYKCSTIHVTNMFHRSALEQVHRVHLTSYSWPASPNSCKFEDLMVAHGQRDSLARTSEAAVK